MILLIAGYMLCGAAIFQIIESDSRVGLAARAIEAGNKKDFKWKINVVYLIFLMLQPSVLFASYPMWRREISNKCGTFTRLQTNKWSETQQNDDVIT